MREKKTIQIILLILAFTALILPKEIHAEHLSPIEHEITVSAAIGEPKLTLFGYGPTQAYISLTGTNIWETTVSNSLGYFEFSKVFLPLPETDEMKLYPELCLQAYYNRDISTQPTCIPPLPIGNYDYRIGPVTLSPTFILEKGQLTKSEQVKASGKTTPNTDVEIYLAREKGGSSLFQIIRDVFAYYIPTYQTQSDVNGNFEFNLPADSPDRWRVFAAAKVLGASSPKSNTLNYQVLPYFYSLLFRFFQLLLKYRPFWYLAIILLEIVLILILIHLLKRKRGKQK